MFIQRTGRTCVQTVAVGVAFFTGDGARIFGFLFFLPVHQISCSSRSLNRLPFASRLLLVLVVAGPCQCRHVVSVHSSQGTGTYTSIASWMCASCVRGMGGGLGGVISQSVRHCVRRLVRLHVISPAHLFRCIDRRITKLGRRAGVHAQEQRLQRHDGTQIVRCGH